MKKNSVLLLVFAVLSCIAIFIWLRSKPSTMADKPLSEFAIEDTSLVNKILITDQSGVTAKLERIPGNKLWKLNDTYFAREDAVNLLLKTFNRIRIRGNVSDSARDNMLKLLATSGKKVAIYMGEDEPAKIYYVGVPTPDHTGTVMLLEIPGIGRSEEPYIVHIEGFTGFLSTRFFTNEMEWRYTGIFEYPNLEFNKVTVVNHVLPESSLEVKYDGFNGLELYGEYQANLKSFNRKIEHFDTSAVKKMLLLFKKVHVESFNTQLTTIQSDSILKMTPTYTISVTGNDGAVKAIDLYLKPAVKDIYDEEGRRNPVDLDYYWAKTMDGELAMAQTYNFMPIVDPIDTYLIKP